MSTTLRRFAHAVPVVLLTLAGAPACLEAGTFYVHQGGLGDFVTIQEGIYAATSGDTVLVAAGTYAEHVHMGPASDGICLLSESGPDATVIDGEDIAGQPVLLLEDVGPQTIICGFSIVRGRCNYWGAGVRCENASPEITGNIVRDNLGSYPGFGGGIGVHSGSPNIVGNHFEANQSADGGAINIWDGAALIEGNTFVGNKGWGFGGTNAGGGVQVSGGSPTISRNRFEGNNAAIGGAIEIQGGADIVISENVFNANYATGLGGAIEAWHGRRVEITRNVFCFNYTHMGDGHGAAMHIRSGDGADAFSITDNVLHDNFDASGTVTVGDDAQPLISSNFFSNATTYEIDSWRHDSPDTIDAVGNWWGTSDPSEVAAKVWDCIDDAGFPCIMVEPWCEDPTCTGLVTGVSDEASLQPITWSGLKGLYRP